MKLPRSSGLLLHISSLPGGCIGDLGPAARQFADICAASGQTYWQLLPICPTGFGYSPYASPSSFAGNPALISPDLLIDDGLLTLDDLKHAPQGKPYQVDYSRVIPFKQHLLQQAWMRFQERGPLDALIDFFKSEEYWLRDHVTFCQRKSINEDRPWTEWTRDSSALSSHMLPESVLESPMGYFVFEQYVFARQWSELRDYCRAQGVRIIGDLPIYVAHDSADVWASQELFQLDASGRPTVVAGVPPDFFSVTGQRWGNPLYDWDKMARNGFTWWKQRLRRALALFDVIRLDHFRGFAGYWEIPASEPTAEIGRWVTGPGATLFEHLERELGHLPVIAEDLGVVTPDVPALMQQFGLHGMVVLQFAFDSDMNNPHLPHNYPNNLVAYTGTHDNDTLLGWWNALADWQQRFARDYLGLSDDSELCESAIRKVLSSQADLVITPVQDVLRLDARSRMNTPGTVGDNWEWRLTTAQLHELRDSAGYRLNHWTAEADRQVLSDRRD